MATFTDVPDTLLEPGKPVRSIDIIALRDNPIAIAEAAAGAPRIVLSAAMEPVAGNMHLIYRAPGDGVIKGTEWARAITLPGAAQNGSVRMRLSISSYTSAWPAQFRVTRNGLVIASWTHGGSSVQHSLDIPVSRNDLLAIDAKAMREVSGNDFAAVTDVTLHSATDSLIW